jgi:formate-nitrite transporter family protein
MESNRLNLPVVARDHIRGSVDAPVTLIEYGDFECPHCQQAHVTIKEIFNSVDGLRFVFRHFPLHQVHPNAERAAQAAEAAGAQGRFWEMHDLLFEHTRELNDEVLKHLARKAALDMDKFTSELEAGTYAERVQDDFKSGLYAGHVTGTPTLYVNDELFVGATFEPLMKAITEAGATVRHPAGRSSPRILQLLKNRFGKTHLRK